MKLTPTPNGKALLTALALPVTEQDPDRAGWWSAGSLQSDSRTYGQFRSWTALQIAGTARGLIRLGYARSRRVGTAGHGWAEYRITNSGRAWTETPPPGDIVTFAVTTHRKLAPGQHGITSMTSKRICASELIDWALNVLPEDAVSVDPNLGSNEVTTLRIDWSKVPDGIRYPFEHGARR
jgi:hypothetical protein